MLCEENVEWNLNFDIIYCMQAVCNTVVCNLLMPSYLLLEYMRHAFLVEMSLPPYQCNIVNIILLTCVLLLKFCPVK